METIKDNKGELKERLKTKQQLRQHYSDRMDELDKEIFSIIQQLSGDNAPDECISCGS